MTRDTDWTKDLSPGEAQAALDAVKGEQGAGHSEGSHRASEAAPGATDQDLFELWRWRWVRLAIPNYCPAAYSGGSPTVAIGRPVGARLVVVVVISIIVPASHPT
jgi:hypothetical protein